MRLDYVVVHADDLGATRDWYAERLGLTAEWDTEEFVLLTGETGARLGVHRGTPLSEPESVHLHFEVDDVDDAYDELRANGVHFDAPPRDTDWGHRAAVLHDPV